MPRVRYRKGTATPDALQEASKYDAILTAYHELGIPISEQQLFYRLVAAGQIEYHAQSYQVFYGRVNRARKLGLLDWAHFATDPFVAPALVPPSVNNDPSQRFHVELILRPTSTMGSLRPLIETYRPSVFALDMRTSETAVWHLSRRLRDAYAAGKELAVLYVMDWDLFGCVKGPGILDKLRLFTGVDCGLQRLAVTQEQQADAIAVTTPNRGLYRKTFRPAYGTDTYDAASLDPSRLHSIVEDGLKQFRNSSL